MAGPGAESPDVARDLEALSVNDVFDNKLTEGRTYLDQALAIRRKRQGERHPLVSQDLMTLGSIAYLQHDSAAAEGYYRAALKTDRTVLGTDHPDVASLENNLARLLIERQDYASAKPLMEHSVAVISRERGETYDDLAFEFDNLALTYRGLGDLSAALPALQKALRAAQLHKSRNVAPILVDMADVRCAQHDARDGALLLEQARPVMAKAYPDDPWRLAWLDTVKGECLNASGASEAARNVLASNRPAITKRWPPGTLYNERSREFLARASR
jgi:tetratricopeptide (TPR) repeat protein